MTNELVQCDPSENIEEKDMFVDKIGSQFALAVTIARTSLPTYPYIVSIVRKKKHCWRW